MEFIFGLVRWILIIVFLGVILFRIFRIIRPFETGLVERLGKFNFSSNLVGLTIQLSYISDGLSYDLNSIVPKFIEDALYSKIMYNISVLRNDIDGGTKSFYKRDAYVKTRNAKIRLQNLKLDEIAQVFRGQSKWIKH